MTADPTATASESVPVLSAEAPVREFTATPNAELNAIYERIKRYGHWRAEGGGWAGRIIAETVDTLYRDAHRLYEEVYRLRLALASTGASGEDTLRCGQCGDDLTLDQIVGHLASEGRRLTGDTGRRPAR